MVALCFINFVDFILIALALELLNYISLRAFIDYHMTKLTGYSSKRLRKSKKKSLQKLEKLIKQG